MAKLTKDDAEKGLLADYERDLKWCQAQLKVAEQRS